MQTPPGNRAHTPRRASIAFYTALLLFFATLPGLSRARQPEAPVSVRPKPAQADTAQAAKDTSSTPSDSTAAPGNTLTSPSAPRRAAGDTVKVERATVPHDTLWPETVVAPDSSLDSTAVAFDSTTGKESAKEEIVELPPDTTAPPAPDPAALYLDRREFTRHGYKDAGDVATIAPGLFRHETSLYAQPYYPVPPGGNGRDLSVLYRNRPYNDPITDAANLSTFAVEEIHSYYLSPGWTGAGPSNSGPVLDLRSPYIYTGVPKTRIVYRQGFYGLGNADWRIAQQVSDDFAYHFGLNIGEYTGRFANTSANTSLLRLGGRQRIHGVGLLGVYWMQSRIRTDRPFSVGEDRVHRNDLDIILSGGRRYLGNYRELGLWYVRMERGYHYGDEDGNRLGARFTWTRSLDSVQTTKFRADLERTAARFKRLRYLTDHAGQRLTGGVTMTHELRLSWLRTQLALRGATASYDATPKPQEPVTRFGKVGGAFTANLGDSLGLGLLGNVLSSWRWPSLDEMYGYWTDHSPGRLMDVIPIPGTNALYQGNPELKPERVNYIGGGPRYTFGPNREARVTAGVRQWRNPIRIDPVTENVYSRVNGKGFTAGEVTGSGWANLMGPVSLAGALTWSGALDKGDPIPDTWGWTSLRFDDVYYNGQLTVRLAVTANYWGSYTYQNTLEPAVWLFDGMFQAKIFNFEVYWGTNNFLSGNYSFMPPFPNMHRDEIFGVRWVLWD